MSFFSLMPRLHKFNCATRLATRSYHFTVELARCNHHLYSNSFFSRTSHLWNFLASLPPTILKNLNVKSIAIFCLPEFCSFISFYSLKSSHFLSLAVAPCVLVALLPCLWWNYLKNKTNIKQQVERVAIKLTQNIFKFRQKMLNLRNLNNLRLLHLLTLDSKQTI